MSSYNRLSGAGEGGWKQQARSWDLGQWSLGQLEMVALMLKGGNWGTGLGALLGAPLAVVVSPQMSVPWKMCSVSS